jgi:hypothetical protein
VERFKWFAGTPVPVKGMRKHAVVLIVMVFMGLVAGCLGGNGEETPSITTTSSPSISTTSNPGESSTSTATVSESTTSTQKPSGPDLDALLEWVSGIRQFIYTGNTTIKMRVITKQNGTLQEDNVTFTVLENAYVDYESWSAWINSTTLSLPDGVTTNSSRIVVNNVTYLQTLVGWVKTEDPSASKILWDYSIVDLARKYLKEKPESVENGEVVKLRYTVPEYELEPLARIYFSASPDSEVTVGNGTLELYFADGELTGGRLGFDVRIKNWVSDPILGNMTITLDGSWSETVKITSVNKKENVEVPST